MCRQSFQKSSFFSLFAPKVHVINSTRTPFGSIDAPNLFCWFSKYRRTFLGVLQSSCMLGSSCLDLRNKSKNFVSASWVGIFLQIYIYIKKMHFSMRRTDVCHSRKFRSIEFQLGNCWKKQTHLARPGKTDATLAQSTFDTNADAGEAEAGLFCFPLHKMAAPQSACTQCADSTPRLRVCVRNMCAPPSRSRVGCHASNSSCARFNFSMNRLSCYFERPLENRQ